MHAAAFSPRGGVAPETTRLRGQSIIEYVLIAAVIGLVVVFAGPQVAGAIRNQFNQLTEMLDDGTSEKAFDDSDIADPENGTAFAVYSEDDHSLMFYKRRGVPQVGDMFNDRRVTEVYTGFETECYGAVDGSNSNGAVNTPWYSRHIDCRRVAVSDYGIAPASSGNWFQNYSQCKSFDVVKLDMSKTAELGNMFHGCESLETLDISAWDLSNAKYLGAMFGACNGLKSIYMPNCNFNSLVGCDWMFESCRSLVLDCTNWNVPNKASHDYFNLRAPNVVLPKAWQ